MLVIIRTFVLIHKKKSILRQTRDAKSLHAAEQRKDYSPGADRRCRANRFGSCVRTGAVRRRQHRPERKPRSTLISRATLILPRTLEIFAQWGVLDHFLEEGNQVPHIRLKRMTDGKQIVHFDFTDLTNDTATPFGLALSQDRTERLLLEAVTTTGMVDVRFEAEVLGFQEDIDGIMSRVRTSEGEQAVRGRLSCGSRWRP
jgi:hypothetical protein